MDIGIQSTSKQYGSTDYDTPPRVRPSFISKAAEWVNSTLPSLPYSAKQVRQENIQIHERAITKTEPQRLLGLRGDDGLLACRLCDGWSTMPKIKEDNWRSVLATRTILRLNNITIFRKKPENHLLESSMIGPNHYFGVLDNTDKHLFSIQSTSDGMPYFIKEEVTQEQYLSNKKIPDYVISTHENAIWLSGKEHENRTIIGAETAAIRQQQSLTSDIGILIFGVESEVITLPRFDAHQFDLSPFGAKLVNNSQPFRIASSKEDPMDVVTYHFGSDYASTMVEEREGIFLETHDFTQIISPMTKDSGGFVTLGNWHKGELQLIGVEIPYGSSIIISKGSIHGDSTLTGSYLMGMTVNHTTMATADVVFLKNQKRKNLMLRLDDSDPQQASSNSFSCQSIRDDKNIKPLVVVSDGPIKGHFYNDIRSQKKTLDQVVRTGSSIVFNPFNDAGRCLRKIV